MSPYNYYGAFFEEMADRGVQHVVCSPGSRSAPLVLSAHAERRLRCWVQLDERAGGFFALGLAKAQRTCVALICTSGSAAANYLPAVTEAFYDGVALVVLTADRPPELRDRGAGQTIDQIHLYGSHVRWSGDLPVAGEVNSEHARYAARRAVAVALGPPAGPVHLNVPLREPLEPPPRPPSRPVEPTAVAATPPEMAAVPAEVAALVDLVRRCERGLIAVGPADLSPADAAALGRLSALAGWPLVADAASGLRGGASGAAVIGTGNHLATAEGFWEAHRPDVIVRVGHPTAGRALREGLAAWRTARTFLVDPLDRWEEPSTIPSGQWRSPIGALAAGALVALSDRDEEPAASEVDNAGRGTVAAGGADAAASARSAWVQSWRHAEATAQEAIDATLLAEPLLEAGVARTLGAALGSGCVLYASNSMPVRDLDGFLAPGTDDVPRVVAHRGTNGIDGVVSAAAGVAAATVAPVVLLAGDLALLHDLGGLLGAVRLGLDLTIVVPNNNGGGIFSFLPVAGAVPPDVFGRFFHTPHDTDLAALLGGLGVRHRRVREAPALRDALAAAMDTPSIDVIEVPVDTAANVAQHRAVEAAVQAALAEQA